MFFDAPADVEHLEKKQRDPRLLREQLTRDFKHDFKMMF